MTSIGAVLEGNKKTAIRFLDQCWNGGDLAAVPELIAGHCRFHDPVFPHMVAGVQSMQHHIERSRRAFPDLRFKIDETIAERDEVVVHWTASGTHQGEFLGIAPTHREARVAGTSIFRVEKGKITEQWINWDLMSLMQQLGTVAGQAVSQRMVSTELNPKG